MFLPGISLRPRSSYLCLPHSWDHRRKPPCPDVSTFQTANKEANMPSFENVSAYCFSLVGLGFEFRASSLQSKALY
jgi:hypothetical protein